MIGWFLLLFSSFLFLPWLLTVWFWCVQMWILWVYTTWSCWVSWMVDWCFPSNLGLLSHYFFKCSLPFSFPFETPIMCMLVHLLLSHTNLWRSVHFPSSFSLYVPKTGYLQLTHLSSLLTLSSTSSRLLLSSLVNFPFQHQSFYLVLYMCICMWHFYLSINILGDM